MVNEMNREEAALDLAQKIDLYGQENDFYEYRDNVEDSAVHVEELKSDILEGCEKLKGIIKWFETEVEESESTEAASLIEELKAFERPVPEREEKADSPLSAYVTNLGKYNEGDLVGEWVAFPVSAEEMQQVYNRIEIGHPDEFGILYEEIFITDYDTEIYGISDELGEYTNLEAINYLAGRLQELDAWELDKYKAVLESGVGLPEDGVCGLINLTYNLDRFDVIPDVHDDYDLGHYYIEEAGLYDTRDMGALANYIDYEGFGRDVRIEEGGEYTDVGYVRDDYSSWQYEFDGTREAIPEEYRLSAPKSAQEQKIDLAQTVADTFSIYQLDDANPKRHDMMFASLAELHQIGEEVKGSNYRHVYTGALNAGETLDSIYERFNLYHPDDFRGHSLSVSDIVVLRKDGQEQAHYVDSFGFKQVPEFFASNPLEKVEELLEDDYGMIDGIINNGPKETEAKKDRKPSLMDRLEEKKAEVEQMKQVTAPAPQKTLADKDL